MIRKDGEFLCDATKEFARGERCYFCDAPPPCDPHHYPPKGRLGVTRDDQLIPACRACHDAAVGVRVIVAGRVIEPPTAKLQEKLVRRFRLRFLEMATSAQFEAYAAARRLWLEQRSIPY